MLATVQVLGDLKKTAVPGFMAVGIHRGPPKRKMALIAGHIKGNQCNKALFLGGRTLGGGLVDQS